MRIENRTIRNLSGLSVAGSAANFAIVSKAKPCIPGVALKERYVMDSIDFLRSQISDLSTKVSTLTSKLDEEIQARTALQNTVEMKLSQLEDSSDGLRQSNSTRVESLVH